MDKERPYFYETDVEWTGEREGELRSPNLPTLEIAAPPEFHGPERRWTPEHLYVASVGACFMTTFLAIAQLSKLEFLSFSVKAKGKLEKMEALGYQMTEIVLRPRAVLRSNRDFDRATRIMEQTGKNCLISKSIKTVIKIEPELFVAQEPTVPCPPISDPIPSNG